MNTQLDIDGDIGWITVDDGKANAMSTDLLLEISARLEETADKARVTVLEGREGIFSAGFDMKTFTRTPAEVAAMLNAGVSLIVRMLEHPHPIVGACTGHAYPMGAFLLLSSDVRIGIDGPYRIGMNEVAIGLAVPKFALALASAKLTPTAVNAILSGRLFSPHDAVRAGYLDRVCDAREHQTAVAEAAAVASAVDPAAYRETKFRINGPLCAQIRAAAAEFQP